ncbi:hypothetical protein 1 [Beihai weivirus-like virus 13]|uniref:hypothetical protein 1 n=1 Tax=Beihai weivirus-like virus 13 TaxID=1922742 RepID=UPI00090BE0CF|nr:hypothetical protein 1 [Beihai weivirus-like virus 13]APG78111.1 hypothetical protein 1 [Beihai weivirus-like virus 13]
MYSVKLSPAQSFMYSLCNFWGLFDTFTQYGEEVPAEEEARRPESSHPFKGNTRVSPGSGRCSTQSVWCREVFSSQGVGHVNASAYDGGLERSAAHAFGLATSRWSLPGDTHNDAAHHKRCSCHLCASDEGRIDDIEWASCMVPCMWFGGRCARTDQRRSRHEDDQHATRWDWVGGRHRSGGVDGSGHEQSVLATGRRFVHHGASQSAAGFGRRDPYMGGFHTRVQFVFQATTFDRCEVGIAWSDLQRSAYQYERVQ